MIGGLAGGWIGEGLVGRWGASLGGFGMIAAMLGGGMFVIMLRVMLGSVG